LADATTAPGPARILVVDDDARVGDLLVEYLGSQAFSPTAVATLADARALLAAHRFDVVLLDLNLGSQDGLDLARELVASQGPPVLIISARGDETDRVVGLEIGVEDYLVKPFSFRELAARIRGVLRRFQEPRRVLRPRRVARFDRWTVDLAAHLAVDGEGTRVELTVGELALLRVFLDNPHRVLLRHELLALTRRDDAKVVPRTIDVLVTRLRRKLEQRPRTPRMLRTVRGEGYRFDPEVMWDTGPAAMGPV
jgi:DNA-binding response OmpR family regulator